MNALRNSDPPGTPHEPSVDERVARGNTLLLLPGFAFQAMVFALAGMLGLEALIVATGGRGWDLVPFLMLALLVLVGLLHYRRARLLEVDNSGVVLRIGKRLKRIPWEEVKEVTHGAQQATTWVYVPRVGYSLSVRMKRGIGRLLVEDSLFRVPYGSLRKFAQTVADMASARGILVVEVQKPLPFTPRDEHR